MSKKITIHHNARLRCKCDNDSCGMLYSYEWYEADDTEEAEWYYDKTKGAQDWSKGHHRPLSETGFCGFD